MIKKRVITIAGRPASGKSTTSKKIASSLGYERFSSGDLFRQLAYERGIDVLEANLSAEQNSEIDHLVDSKLQEIGTVGDRIVIDSRTAWHWMPASFKVFLDLDLEVAAERVINNLDDRKLANELIPKNTKEYAMTLRSRLESETRRYRRLYDIDPYDKSNYDLVIDTEKANIDQAVEKIIDAYNTWLAV